MSKTRAAQVFYWQPPSAVVWSYAAALCLAYIVVIVLTPLAIASIQRLDDALFMQLGQALAEGHWLGPYNELTLLKGPGYPLFLALGNWAGLSASMARASFHCAAVVCFVSVAHRAHRSFLVSGVLLTLLLWHPISLTSFLLRILRDQISYGQILLVIAMTAWSLFFATGLRQKLVAIVAGLILGWTWLTREEGLAILLMLLPLFLAALIRARQTKALQRMVGVLIIYFATFASTQLAYRAANYLAYGTFVGVETKSPSYLHALRELHGVRSGGIRPYVSITNEAMKRVFAVSPAFASLRDHLQGPPSDGWRSITCTVRPSACGDIGGGFFMFALIGAAKQQGHYETPAKAAAFYERIAEEVSEACHAGKLECAPQWLPEMPPATWAQITGGFWKNIGPVVGLLLYKDPPLNLVPSQRSINDSFEANLSFLNFPSHTAPMIAGSKTGTTTLTGWYRKTGSQWFSVQANEFGAAVSSYMDRLPSPDVQAHFDDTEAAHQRFRLLLQCASDNCIVLFQGADGSIAERTLANLRSGDGFQVGEAWIRIDFAESASAAPQRSTTPSAQEEWANIARVGIASNYQYIALPTFAAGVLAFAVTAICLLRTALASLTFLLAMTCWLGVIIRVGLLLLVDVTSFPALSPQYLAPAYYLLVAASVLSCAALLKAWIGDRTLPQQTFRAGA